MQFNSNASPQSQVKAFSIGRLGHTVGATSHPDDPVPYGQGLPSNLQNNRKLLNNDGLPARRDVKGQGEPTKPGDRVPAEGATGGALRPKRNVQEIPLKRQELGRDIASRLAGVAEEAGHTVGKALSQVMFACCDSKNIWTGQDLHRDDTGELYDGAGTLFACCSRLCPFCSSALRRRSRKRVRAVIKYVENRIQVPASWRTLRWRFLTLTGPRDDGLGLVQKIRDVYQKAWAMLRKRGFFSELNVEAGCKAVEFTVTEEGYHVHIHLLLFSKWNPQQEISREWTDCLKRAYKDEIGQELVIDTKNGLCIVDVRAVKPKAKGLWSDPNKCSIEFAVREVCKYITKSDSWMKISDEYLLEVAEVNRWPRLFEVIGNCRKEISKFESKSQEAKEGPNAAATSLDTKNLSDGGNKVAWWLEDPRGWRERLEALGFDDWKADFNDRLQMIRRLRKEQLAEKFPHALFQDLNGLKWFSRQNKGALF